MGSGYIQLLNNIGSTEEGSKIERNKVRSETYGFKTLVRPLQMVNALDYQKHKKTSVCKPEASDWLPLVHTYIPS